MSLRVALASLVIMAFVATVTVGCTAPLSGTSAGQDGSVVQTSTGGAASVETSDGTTGGTTASGEAASSTKPDSSVDAQLDAMQKELDNLAMPADGDFDGAAGSVY